MWNKLSMILDHTELMNLIKWFGYDMSLVHIMKLQYSIQILC